VPLVGNTASPVGGAMTISGNGYINITGNNITATNRLIGIYVYTDTGEVMNANISNNTMNLPIYYSAGVSADNTGKAAATMNLTGSNNDINSNPVACAPLYYAGTQPTSSTLTLNGVACY